jgi:cellulose biosynthesis protein BcsQ
MAVKDIFAIWNNKGGVGKSTITFHLASRYAEKNRSNKVLVIDLCPQANSSMMLLGGGTIGENQATLFCSEATPKTVVGYLSHVISGGQGAPLPPPSNFLVKIKDYNQRLPDNLYLLCGDGNLEPMSPAIIQAANAPSLIPSSNPWVWIHQIFLNLINQIADKEDWMVFIDTNPSFSIYTELAISAAKKLIVPVNADDSSRVATNAMFILLHGTTPPHPVYGSWTFATRATTSKLPVLRFI